MLVALLASLALATPPGATCEPFSFDVPIPELEFKVPKGFAWEGLTPLAALRDGRVLLARHAALGGVSKKAMVKQQQRSMKLKNSAESPWRVTQIVIVDPSGAARSGPVLQRGNPIEVAELPGGTLVLAHRARETTSLLVLSPDASTIDREIELPDDIRYDGRWRDRNAVKGTGVPRLFPVDASTVIHAFDGAVHAIDVTTGTVSDEVQLLTNQMAVVTGADGAEVIALETGDRLLRLGPDLRIRDQRECVDCQIVGLRASTHPAPAAALARPVSGGVRVGFVRAGQSLAALPEGVDLPIPSAIADDEISSSLRAGTEGTAVLSLTGLGQDTGRFAYAFAPDQREPVWRYTAPEIGGRGELLVADAVQGQVRLRLVLTDGKLEQTSHSALLDPATGRATDWLAVAGAGPELRPTLTDSSAPAGQGVHSGLLPDVDPMLDRTPHGSSRATLRRCALESPTP